MLLYTFTLVLIGKSTLDGGGEFRMGQSGNGKCVMRNRATGHGDNGRFTTYGTCPVPCLLKL